MDPYAEAFPVSCSALGLKHPARVHIKKLEGKWVILIQDRIFYVARLEVQLSMQDWPHPFTNWPEIYKQCKEDMVKHTRRISKLRAQETRDKKRLQSSVD